MKILLIHHFFQPDTVISARIFADLAEELVKAGHQVTVFTGNRLFRSGQPLPSCEKWNGVEILRYFRPDLSQKSDAGRLLNSAIMQLKWLRAFRRRRREFDVVILGTDPQFGYLMFPWLRLMNRKVRLIHWVFDMFPEAVITHPSRWKRIPAILIKPLTLFCYRFVNDMVDIGPSMRELLQNYHHRARCMTLTPWALTEPEALPVRNEELRRKLFGDHKLALLYSGTIGRAHDVTPFFALARRCRELGIDAGFCFAGFGNCCEEQLAQISAEDTNIRVAGFTSEADLETHLAVADIHMVALRPGWEGVVVPSKFFGSLAIGRPVIFCGPENCEVARWCREFQIGTMLSDDTPALLNGLLQDPEKLAQWQRTVFACYQEVFSKQKTLSGWLKLLQES